MVRMYAKRPLTIVTLSINNPDEKPLVSAFLQKQHAFNKNYLFNSNDAADAVKALRTGWEGGAPYTVLIGTNGEVLYRTQGEMNVLDVRRAILRTLRTTSISGSTAIGTANSERGLELVFLCAAVRVTRANEDLRREFYEQVRGEHAAIAEAILRQDPEAAATAAKVHMLNAAVRLHSADPEFWTAGPQASGSGF
jgi:hypothetical protein